MAARRSTSYSHPEASRNEGHHRRDAAFGAKGRRGKNDEPIEEERADRYYAAVGVKSARKRRKVLETELPQLQRTEADGEFSPKRRMATEGEFPSENSSSEYESSPKRRGRRAAKDNKKQQKNALASNLLIVLGFLLITISFVIASVILYQYHDAQRSYDEIVLLTGLDIPIENNIVVVPDSFGVEDIVIDWDALRAVNPQVVGWMIIPGTRINYPIVQGADNEYYLNHLFDGKRNGSGTLFVDYLSSSTLDGQNNFIYGHNMLDGTMFSDFLAYKSSDYLEEHQTIYLATPGCVYELRAIAALRPSGNEPIRVFSFNNTESYENYRKLLFSYSISKVSDFDSAVAEADMLFSFVTCDKPDNKFRIIITAIPVQSISID